MKLSRSYFSRPVTVDRTLDTEVENLRRGLESLPGEPELLNEVALCLAYLSLGEHGRASLALRLVEEFHQELEIAASHLSPVRKTSFESLLRRVETIAHIQATRNALQSGMQFHSSHYDRPFQMGGTQIAPAA